MANGVSKTVFSYWFQKCKFDVSKKCTQKSFSKKTVRRFFWYTIRPIQRIKVFISWKNQWILFINKNFMSDIWASRSLVSNPDLLFEAKTQPGKNHFIININITVPSYKVADPHHFNADPDSAPHQTDANQRPRHWSTHPLGLPFEHPRLHYECQRPSTAPYWDSTPPLWASAALFGSILGLHASIVSYSGPPRLYFEPLTLLNFAIRIRNPAMLYSKRYPCGPVTATVLTFGFPNPGSEVFLWIWIRIFYMPNLYLHKCHGKIVELAMETYKYYCKKFSLKDRKQRVSGLASDLVQ